MLSRFMWVLPAMIPAWLTLSGCHRGSDGPEAAPRQAPSGPLTDRQALSRADILLDIAHLPHAEVAQRLGPHRIESHTHYTITPIAAPGFKAPPEVAPGFREGNPVHPFEGPAAFENTPVTLDETRAISVDGLGNLALENKNDHDYGVEASLLHEDLYVRMRYAPFIRRRPEGDEIERLRAVGYESGAALLEAVAPYIYLSTPTETTRLNRPAWQVSLAKKDRDEKRRVPGTEIPGKAWRGAVAVDTLDGYAVVDRQRGALLELRVKVRFVAPRKKAPPGTPQSADGERVTVEAEHELRVVALGAAVNKILAPAEWIDPPTRPRPTQDKQELLNGLLAGTGTRQ